MVYLKLYENFVAEQNLLGDISKRFFSNDIQLKTFISNILEDPQWPEQPLQAITNLGYGKWLKDQEFNNYISMLKWLEKDAGKLPLLLTQFLRYYQNIFNAGHLKYYTSGFAATDYKEYSTNYDSHKVMVDLFNVIIVQMDLKFTNKKEIFNIMNSFNIKTTENSKGVLSISNTDELKILDDKFKDFAVEFLNDLETFVREFVKMVNVDS